MVAAKTRVATFWLLVAIAAAAGLLGVCGGREPTPTAVPSPVPTATPTPVPTQTQVATPPARAGQVALQPDQGASHLPPGQRFGSYITLPATSGPHWITPPIPFVPTGAPARWGFYEQELPDEVLVHNLEHGGIGIHYNCSRACPELVQQLTGLVPPDASQFIVAPYADMDHRIAVTAWRRVLYLEEFHAAQIQFFIENYQDRAPESVPGNLF